MSASALCLSGIPCSNMVGKICTASAHGFQLAATSESGIWHEKAQIHWYQMVLGTCPPKQMPSVSTSAGMTSWCITTRVAAMATGACAGGGAGACRSVATRLASSTCRAHELRKCCVTAALGARGPQHSTALGREVRSTALGARDMQHGIGGARSTARVRFYKY